MTVAELIEWLKQQPQTAKVLLHDPDTDWFLEAKFGPNEYASPEDVPADAVCLHCTYW